jgi:hypothetical protein
MADNKDKLTRYQKQQKGKQGQSLVRLQGQIEKKVCPLSACLVACLLSYLHHFSLTYLLNMSRHRLLLLLGYGVSGEGGGYPAQRGGRQDRRHLRLRSTQGRYTISLLENRLSLFILFVYSLFSLSLTICTTILYTHILTLTLTLTLSHTHTHTHTHRAAAYGLAVELPTHHHA